MCAYVHGCVCTCACAWVHMCMHACTCLCGCLCMCIGTNICMWVCIYLCVGVCMSMCMHIHVCICMYVHVCLCVGVCVHAWDVYAHVCVCAGAHVHAHMYLRLCGCVGTCICFVFLKTFCLFQTKPGPKLSQSRTISVRTTSKPPPPLTKGFRYVQSLLAGNPTCINVHPYVCMCMLDICAPVWVHTCACTSVYVWVCMYMCVGVYARVHVRSYVLGCAEARIRPIPAPQTAPYLLTPPSSRKGHAHPHSWDGAGRGALIGFQLARLRPSPF